MLTETYIEALLVDEAHDFDACFGTLHANSLRLRLEKLLRLDAKALSHIDITVYSSLQE